MVGVLLGVVAVDSFPKVLDVTGASTVHLVKACTD